MKHRLTFITLATVFLLTLASCRKNDAEPIIKYKMTELTDICYQLKNSEAAIFPYDGKIYASTGVGADSAKIGYYDISKDMEYTCLAELSANALYVNDNGIYALSGDKVTVIDHDGQVTKEYDIALKYSDDIYIGINVSDSSVIVTETSQDECFIHILNAETGAEKVISPDSDYDIDKIYYAEQKNKNDFVLICRYTDALDLLKNGLFEYSLDDNELSYICDCEGEFSYDYIAEENAVYTINCDYSVLQLMRINEKNDTEILRNVSMEKYMELLKNAVGNEPKTFSCHKVFYTGQSFIIWEKYTYTVNIYSYQMSADGETITALYPVKGEINFSDGTRESTVYDDIDYDMITFENLYDCRVRSKTYQISEFTDRLRMKLLAGEDDFDIVYADRCDRGDILSAILRYQLYLPLESYTGIVKNLENLAGGVADFMTYDGHLIGCPYSFGGISFIVNDAFYDSGLTLPDKDWTMDDFYALCDSAVLNGAVNSTTALFFSPARWIFAAIIQNGIDNGKLEYEEIERAVEKIDYYTKLGVFSDYRKADVIMIASVDIPPQAKQDYAKDVSMEKVLSIPLYNGKKYAPLNSFVFVNRKTRHDELSAAYIEMLLSEDFVPSISGDKTFFAVNPDSYFTLEWGDSVSIAFRGIDGLEVNKWNKIPLKMSNAKKYFASKISDVFVGMQISSLDSAYIMNENGTWTLINSVMNQLEAGEITTKQAADSIYSHAKARYME